MVDLEVRIACRTHPVGLPLSLVFCMVLYMFQDTECYDPTPIFLFQCFILRVMDGKELRKAEVCGYETVEKRHILAVSQFVFHLTEMDRSVVGILGFLFNVTTVLQNCAKH